MTDAMASETSASPDKSAPTQSKNAPLCIKKGTSADALETLDPIDIGDDVKTATQLRTLLVGKGLMVESDQFLGKDDSFLKHDSEDSTQWSDLATEKAFAIITLTARITKFYL
jgi:hypothetical protein